MLSFRVRSGEVCVLIKLAVNVCEVAKDRSDIITVTKMRNVLKQPLRRILGKKVFLNF